MSRYNANPFDEDVVNPFAVITNLRIIARVPSHIWYLSAYQLFRFGIY